MDFHKNHRRHYHDDRNSKRAGYKSRSNSSKRQRYGPDSDNTIFKRQRRDDNDDASSTFTRHRSNYDEPKASQRFVTVDLHSKYFKSVEDKFNSIVAPIYGDQKCALQKIASGEDRKCELLICDDVPVGMLVYKTNTSSEFNDLNNSMEIKTIVSFDPEKSNILETMLKKAKGIAESMNSDFIHVTVSDQVWKTLSFLRRNKFKVLERWENKYGKNIPEFLMRLDLHEPVIKDSITLGPQYIRMIKNNQKTVEGRLNSQMFQKLRENDLVKFFQNRNPSLFVTCRITKVVKYDTFKEMLEIEGYKNCIPNADSLGHAVKIYKDIPRYSEKERRLGVLAFHIVPV